MAWRIGIKLQPLDLITPQMLLPAQAAALPALPPQAKRGQWCQGRRTEEDGESDSSERRTTPVRPSSFPGPPVFLVEGGHGKLVQTCQHSLDHESVLGTLNLQGSCHPSRST